MKKWAAGLDIQRTENAPKASQSPDAPPPDFAWMRTQSVSTLENPYAQQDEEEDDDITAPQYNGAIQSTGGTLMRNASSTSLRQRSATGESTQSLASIVRAPPPRFPLPTPPAPLSLQTQMSAPAGVMSPEMSRGGPGDSYFSPVAESPVSSRTSTASSMFQSAGYPFPKTSTPQPGWEDSNRYTAPAMPRAPSRDGPSPNPYGINGRNPRGPSLPVMPQSQSAAQQQRSRSYSTPDIAPPPGMRPRTTGGTPVPAVPGIPAHLHHDNNIPRSQTGSPRLTDIPVRANTQSPGVQRERLHQASGSYGGQMSQFPAQPLYPRQMTPNPMPAPLNINPEGAARTAPSPQIGSGTPQMSSDLPIPTQLKVKVNCDSGNYVTLVVAFNITYQSLIDRIDAKLARFTNSSIGKGMLKLRYRDEDGDFVSIESDDDIQIAFLEWRDGQRNMFSGGVGEIELFCVGETV
jgi:cell division control protein 24